MLRIQRIIFKLNKVGLPNVIYKQLVCHLETYTAHKLQAAAQFLSASTQSPLFLTVRKSSAGCFDVPYACVVLIDCTVEADMATSLICGRLTASLKNPGTRNTLRSASKVSVWPPGSIEARYSWESCPHPYSSSCDGKFPKPGVVKFDISNSACCFWLVCPVAPKLTS